MKNENGITLVSLVLYAVIMLILIGVVAVIKLNTDKNIVNIQNLKGYVSEINKLSMYMVEETKNVENGVKKITGDGSAIEFNNGNKYIFTNNIIYKVSADDKKIPICTEIKNCEFKYKTENKKEMVSITIRVGEGDPVSKTLEYVFAI